MSGKYESCADIWMKRFRENNPEIAKTADRELRIKSVRNNHYGMVHTAVQSKNRGISNKEGALPKKSRLSPIVASAIEVRQSLQLSQAEFARRLNISPRTLRDWEQGRRQPSGAALTLLTWISENPDYL